MDEKFSRDVKQYRDRLQCSFFVRYKDASDGVGFAVAFVAFQTNGRTLHFLGFLVRSLEKRLNLLFLGGQRTEVLGAALHYGLGVGLFHVWHERVIHMAA